WLPGQPPSMPLIIGTAGHIDHGKTSLIRALTGQDTDRLKEEKERGISIDLGFAYLDADGERAGIVDVPGHDRVNRHLPAGAHGGPQLGRPAGAPPPGYFRLPVDRAFVIRGHGVVVTGTAIAGAVREGDTLRVLPGGETARVRSLEVHGVHVPRAEHGQRVAINLAGVERSDLGRGHVVCDERLARLTARLDARVEIRPAAKRPIASHTRVRFHLGTAEVMGKLVLLGGRGELSPRSAGWAQLVLAEPVLAMRGDRFILRDETARRTLGGGVVVNPFADRHRR